jgi:F0F1-type ATP synthase membrane subunit b/b'
MVILNNLLYKPILKIMDERKERIEKAAQKKAEYMRLEEEYASMLEQKKKALEEASKKRMKEEIDSIRQNTNKAIDTAQDERLQKVDHYRAAVVEEQATIMDTLCVHSKELATAFVNNLIKE